MIKVKTRSDLRQEEAMQKGFYAFVDGDIEQSISYFEKASEQFPINNDFLNFDYASMLAKIGLFDLSQKRLINISDYQIWNKRIENLYKVSYPKTIPQREEEIALAKATSAVSFSKTMPEDIQGLLPYKKYKNSDYANYLYSKYYFKKSDFKKSETFIKRALKIYPENYQYKYNLADILSRREKYDRTLKVLAELDLSPILDKRLSKNIQLLEYSTRASKTKDITMKNYYMANYYFAKSDFQQAQGLLKVNIQKKPQMIENYLLNARINLGKDDYLKAESDYQTALRINSDNEEALLGLGDINLFLNNKQKAYDFYAKALKNNKKSLNAMKKMANYQESSSNNDYITYYKKIQELYPDDIDSLLKLAESDYLRGDKIQANEKYKKILSLDQNCAQAWFGLSKIAIDNKNTYIAREYLLPVYYLNKFNPEYYYYSGLINNIDQNYPQAMVDFKKALELDPSNIKSLIELKKMN
jgi:tetratricopeptide (TPR) repeat protein